MSTNDERSEGRGSNDRATDAASHLARAAQRHRLYPPSNPLCVEAAASCHAALKAGPHGSLKVEVEPGGIRIDDRPPPDTRLVAELGERLFRADVETVRITEDAGPSEIGRFCTALARVGRGGETEATLSELLTDLGVLNVHVRAVSRAEVLDTEVLSADLAHGLLDDRRARGADDEGKRHERHRAWLQVDRDCSVEDLELTDLAYLVEDPAHLARIVEAASGGAPDPEDPDRALAEHIGDLILLYSRLGSEASSDRFLALARAFRGLDAERRSALLHERLLPELLETGRSRPFLARLDDEELAGGLERMRRLAIGSDELISMALDRLDLAPERRHGLERRLGARAAEAADGAGEDASAPLPSIPVGGEGLDDATAREFRGHDLAMTDEARDELARLGEALVRFDEASVRLHCLADLVRHTANPDRLRAFVEEAEERLGRLADRDLRSASVHVREWVAVADALRASTPAYAASVDAMLGRICSVSFLRENAGRLSADQPASRFVLAFGSAAAPSLMEAMHQEEDRSVRRFLLDFACANAAALAGGLEPLTEDSRWMVRRNVVRVLGFAGEVSERRIRPLLGDDEPRVAREAMFALARIGSDEGARTVERALRRGEGHVVEIGEEAVRHFPRDRARRLVRGLLADPRFVRRHASTARRLLRRHVAGGGEDAALLRALVPLRFRIWRPGLAALGWDAWRMLRGSAGS